MPQRFLRPGITNSDRWNSCSEPAQGLFIRLLTVVDDYGRFDGRPAVILGACYSVWNALNSSCQHDVVTVTALCEQLAKNKLISFYEIDGKRFLQFEQWGERARVKSKWPEPNLSNVVSLTAACQHDVVTVTAPCAPPSPSPSPSPSSSSSSSSSSPPLGLGEDFKLSVWFPDEHQKRLSRIFKRRESTKFSDKELKAYKAVSPIAEDELDQVERYYKAVKPEGKNHCRHDLMTLLNNWNGEVDRARAFNSASGDEKHEEGF